MGPQQTDRRKKTSNTAISRLIQQKVTRGPRNSLYYGNNRDSSETQQRPWRSETIVQGAASGSTCLEVIINNAFIQEGIELDGLCGACCQGPDDIRTDCSHRSWAKEGASVQCTREMHRRCRQQLQNCTRTHAQVKVSVALWSLWTWTCSLQRLSRGRGARAQSSCSAHQRSCPSQRSRSTVFTRYVFPWTSALYMHHCCQAACTRC